MRGKRRKINNEFIDNYLIENNIKIKRGDNFVVSNELMTWECLIDGHKWKTVPSAILKKDYPTRCPKCKGGVKHTFKGVCILLDKLNLELMDLNYENNNKKLKCKCKNCNNIFYKTLHQIKGFDRNTKYKSACPSCNNRIKYTNESVDKKLLEDKRNIIRLTDVSKAKEKVTWKCLSCNTIWQTTPQSILIKNRRTGCPTCKNKKENELKRYLVDTVKCDYFKHQYKLYIDNRKRFVDFCIIKNDNVYFIERNGEQHYAPICFNGISRNVAEQNFEKQLIKDKQLKDFCEEYGIKLIVIKYDMAYEEIQNIINKL